ncbi:MAG: CDGSH iron-sulfur domain-containing protein [Pseudomonadota bacterium]
MTDPIRAGDAPLPVKVEAGKAYFWCTCGRSSKQPFCDGSHQVTDLAPMRWEAPETKTVFFCTCKQTGGAPLCDGSHNKG